MIVILRATSKVAKKHGIRITPKMKSKTNYITGQGIVIGDSTTSNDLTFEEMSGKVPLSKEKLKRFPFVIAPTDRFTFKDGHKFDTESPEGAALLKLVLVTNPFIAKDFETYDRVRHVGYIHNREVESEKKVKVFRQNIKAGVAVEKLNHEELRGLGTYLFVHQNESLCSPEQPFSIIEGAIYDYADKKPNVILEALREDNKIGMLVSQIVMKGIVTKRSSGEYYEGNSFVAGDFNKLVSLYSTDLEKSSRWDKKLREKGVNAHVTFEEPVINVQKTTTDLLALILNKDVDGLKDIIKVIKTSGDNELMELLIKYKDMTDVIIAPKKKAKVIETNGTDETEEDVLMSAAELLKAIEDKSLVWGVLTSKLKKAFPEYAGETNKVSIIEFLNTKV